MIYILILFVIFLILLIIIKKTAVIKELLKYAVLVLSVWFVFLKLILLGYNIIIATLITSLIIISLNTIINNRFTKKSIISIIAAFLGATIAGFLTLLFSNLININGINAVAIKIGLNPEEITFSLKDLIFTIAQIVATGSCVEIAINTCSALYKTKDRTQDISFKKTFKSGINFGAQNIEIVLNTLIFSLTSIFLTVIVFIFATNVGESGIFTNEVFLQSLV